MTFHASHFHSTKIADIGTKETPLCGEQRLFKTSKRTVFPTPQLAGFYHARRRQINRQ